MRSTLAIAILLQLFPGRPTPVVTGPIVVTSPFKAFLQVRINGVVQDVAIDPSLRIIPANGTQPMTIAATQQLTFPYNAVLGNGLMWMQLSDGTNIISVDRTALK